MSKDKLPVFDSLSVNFNWSIGNEHELLYLIPQFWRYGEEIALCCAGLLHGVGVEVWQLGLGHGRAPAL